MKISLPPSIALKVERFAVAILGCLTLISCSTQGSSHGTASGIDTSMAPASLRSSTDFGAEDDLVTFEFDQPEGSSSRWILEASPKTSHEWSPWPLIRTFETTSTSTQIRRIRLLTRVPSNAQRGATIFRVRPVGGESMMQTEGAPYQVLRPSRRSSLRIDYASGRLILKNDHMTVLIDGETGSIQGMRDHQGGEISLQESFRFQGSNLRLVDFKVEAHSNSYGRVALVLADENGIENRRTLEFTRGPHLFVNQQVTSEQPQRKIGIQWDFSSTSSPKGLGLQTSDLGENARQFRIDETRRVIVGMITPDLLIETPDGELGGLSNGLRGYRSLGQVEDFEDQVRHHLLRDGYWFDLDRDQRAVEMTLGPGWTLQCSRVISLDLSGHETHQIYSPRFLHTLSRNEFHTGFGRLSKAISRAGWTFANWNNFQYASELAPIHHQAKGTQAMAEAMLLRMGHYTFDRLAQDDGWFEWFAWNGHPKGAHFTPHARAFPFLVYLCAYLSQSAPHDLTLDRFTDQLQDTISFFRQESPENFVEELADGTRYFGYATSFKHQTREDVQWVGNSHAHAYRFAHLMAELSELLGDQDSQENWEEVLAWADRGSERAFQELYPAIDRQGTEQWGLIGYRQGDRRVINMAYNDITWSGLIDALQHAGQSPLELIDAVDRASTDYREDTSQGESSPRPDLLFLERACRALPLAWAFAEGSETRAGDFASSIEYAPLQDVLGSAERTPHRPDRMIRIHQSGSVALTNRPFLTRWIPGQFEEITVDEMDPSSRFHVRDLAEAPTAFWAAELRGDRLRATTNQNQTTLRIDLEVPAGRSLWMSTHRYQNGRWEQGEARKLKTNSYSDQRTMGTSVTLDRKEIAVLWAE